MQQLEQVNEQSTAYLAVTFRDKAGAAQAPSSASYCIDDVASGQEVRGDTVISAPGSTVEITLSPADNTLRNEAAAYEKRRVTVTALYGADDAVRSEYVYRVINLAGVQSGEE